MSPDEYRETILQLGMTQARAAKLLGVDERTSRRWACGERDIPPPVMQFLRYLLASGRTGDHALKMIAKIASL